MFGDTANNEIVNAVFRKLEKWINDPPDYQDVSEAYHYRAEMQGQRIKLLRQIENIEEEILADENNKPRSNETRIKKAQATKHLRDHLALLEAAIAENDSQVKFLEFRRDMFKSAIYRTKVQFDL